MRTIYLDSDYKCHVADDGTMTPVETKYFDGKCDTYIEGYRFVPEGEIWTREDGVEFTGEMVAPWRDYTELDAAQRFYERERLPQLQSENDELTDTIATMVDEVYNSDMEMMGI